MSDAPRVLTCVYCGHEYPQDTPAWGDKVLTDHIKVCKKHPMHKAMKVLKVCRKVFQKYVSIHSAKGTHDGAVKAIENQKMVKMIDKVL